MASMEMEVDEPVECYDRPPLPRAIVQNQSAPLQFQIVDVDYVQEPSSVRLRIYGVTREGCSVCCSITGYVPYFYFLAPQGYDRTKIPQYIQALNANIREDTKKNEQVVLSLEEVRGASLLNYTEDMNQLFLKISLTTPRIYPKCKGALQKVLGNGVIPPCFESNIDFEIRFMSDLGIVGCCWMEAPARKYTIRPDRTKETRCQIEATVAVKDIIAHKPDDPWLDIAPFRTLSFDIECLSRPGVFPEPAFDGIIQIACVCKQQGAELPMSRVCFVLDGCAPIAGVRVISCSKETELLRTWADYVRDIDADILTGYNIQNFDIPYIMDRAKALGKETHRYVATTIARAFDSPCEMRDITTSSTQMGTRTNKRITLNGRIVFDAFQVIRREYTLRSYTLNNVSYHFLNDQKEDVEYTIINDLHRGTMEQRRRLALYCLKDAELPMRLLDKLMLVVNYIEMARVTGVPLNFLISRGQQVKILSQLLRKARTMNYFLPVIERSGDDSGYEGATVIEPEKGFYKQPIATLDFASLYPSIMIAHNLCYTTVMPRPPKEFVENVDFIKTPAENFFVTAKRKRGLLPLVLEDLLAARKKAKAELKAATDPLKQMVLNGRQLALKISANSVYGFTGATVGKLPCLEISASVTSFGRQMIEQTKKMVETTYTKGAHGMLKDARVIYGDTDSVMVDFGVDTVAEAMRFGQHAAGHISKTFIAPIKLEFEKVYWPYLLVNKKRYAGVYYTRPDTYDKIDTKGMETIRRDNCPLVGIVMNKCLETMLLERDPIAAIDYAKAVITELLKNEIDISMLIITKELTKTTDKYEGKQAHSVLAERMRARDPGSAPKLGDRVPFVYVSKGKNVPAYDKAEDPNYVLKNKLPIDTEYYLHNQLLKPLVRLLDPVTGNKAEEKLTQGKHARVRAVPVSTTVGMGQFTQKRETCTVCRSVLPDGSQQPLCDHCLPKLGQIYTRKMHELRLAQHRFSRLWTECQNCAEDFTNEVQCGAKDCPIFYMREKTRVDLEEKTKAIRRFDAFREAQQ